MHALFNDSFGLLSAALAGAYYLPDALNRAYHLLAGREPDEQPQPQFIEIILIIIAAYFVALWLHKLFGW